MSQQQSHTTHVFRPAWLAGLLCAQGACHLAAAQDAASQSSGADQLDEIVVTAQKREQNLQDVGTSITAFDAGTLRKLGFQNTTDIARQVPGLQFNQFSTGLTIFSLRGVSQNDFSDHEEAPVAVYEDDAYVAAMGAISGATFDLERVEVLKGPQGTLFGRNATGGLIHFVSERPKDAPEASLSITAGQFHEIDTQGVLNYPLADSVDARLSFATNYHDGVIQNRVGPDPENEKQYAVRLQFLFKLNPDARLLLKLHETRNAHETATNYSWAAAYPDPNTFLGNYVPPGVDVWGTCPGCDLGGYRNPGGSQFDQAFNRTGLFDRTIRGATGHLDWRLGPVDLTLVTDFLRLDKRYGEDSDASPNTITNYDSWQAFHQFSQEVRLSSSAGHFKWIGGVYFLDMNTRDRVVVQFGGPLAFLSTPGTDFDLKTRSIAGFAQAEWSFSDRWTAIAGARYTRDQKVNDYVLYATYPMGPPDLVFNRHTDPDIADQIYNLPSWKAELDYRLGPEIMAYGSINRGAKSGGFDEPPTTPAPASVSQLTFRPEKLTSYEVGEKATFWNGRARLNAAAFYYDYRDYQAFELINGVNLLVKNYDARVKGGELELSLLPFKGGELHMGVSRLDSVIKNVVLPGGQVVDRVMPQAPKWSVNAVARYQWNAFHLLWFVQADTKTDTSEYFEAFNPQIDYEPGKTYGNLRVGFSTESGSLEIAGFCNNCTDRRYRIYSLDESAIGIDQGVYALPRWLGATVTYHIL